MPDETGPIVEHISLSEAMTIGGFFSVAVYNSLEIYISIFRRFTRRRGLYFWTMLCANTGIPITSLFVLLRFFKFAAPGPMSILVDIGWWLMVTGQSLVLYSRLHLVVGDQRKLRWLLCMIGSVFLFLQIPTAVIFGVVSFRHGSSKQTTAAFNAIEIAQLMTITAQESILSGVYIYASSRTLGPMEIIKGPKVRKIRYQLVALFVAVVALDISIIAVQFAGYFYIQCAYKPVVYSIKLKVEAFVLSNLVSLIAHPDCNCQLGTVYGSEGRPLDRTVDDPRPSQYTLTASAKSNMVGHGISTPEDGRSVSTVSGNRTGKVQVPTKVLTPS